MEIACHCLALEPKTFSQSLINFYKIILYSFFKSLRNSHLQIGTFEDKGEKVLGTRLSGHDLLSGGLEIRSLIQT